MARDILSEYGPDYNAPQAARASSGGIISAKPLPYSAPQGPTNIGDAKSPGLHGDNCGNAGSQGYYGPIDKQTSGSPGLHGSNRGMGTNRKG